MKKLSLILGAFFIGITIIAMLLKILHLKGADFGILLGLAGLALVAVPLYTIAVVNRKKDWD